MGLPAEKIRTRPLLSVHRAANRFDPTKTLFLRQSFVRDFSRRFRALKAAIFKAIVTEDVFGLTPGITRVMVMETALTTPGHQAFAFPRSSEKVEKFMAWLKTQEEAGLLQIGTGYQLGSSVEDAWTSKYVLDSYSRGVQRARYELAHAGYGVPSMEATGGVLASMSLPFHMDRVGLLYTRTFSELTGVTSAMDQTISRVLSQSMADGDGARVIAKKLLSTISGVGDLSFTDKIGRFIPAEQRAEMIARTETIRAFAEAQLQEYKNWGAVGVSAQVEFQTAGDSRVCPRCASMQGKVYTLDEASGVIPVHPRCLIESSRISPTSVTAATKRWYEGQVIIIGTAGGKKLTCTPNHPILTDKGWVAAGLLNEGGNVVCGLPGNLDSPISGHDQDIPATIKEITEAFGRSGQMASREVPGSSPDFHGDGVDGNVTIIWSDRKLRNEGNTGYAQEAPQDQFMAGNIARSLLKGLSSLNLFLNRHIPAPSSLMRRLYLTTLGFGRHPFPFPALCFGLATGGDAVLSENPVNDRAIHPEFQMKGVGGHPGKEPLANFFFRDGDKVVISQGDPGFQDNPLDDFVRHIETPGNGLDGFPGEVLLDNITSLGREFFSGHVYNLQTPKEYYIAEGIATHNCRCCWLPKDMTGKEAAKQGPVAVAPPVAVPESTFIPAKNIQEATNWALNNLIDPVKISERRAFEAEYAAKGIAVQEKVFVSYRGLSLESANIVNEKLDSLYQRGMPKLNKIVSTFSKDTWAARMSNLGELEINTKFAKTPELAKSFIAQTIDKKQQIIDALPLLEKMKGTFTPLQKRVYEMGLEELKFKRAVVGDGIEDLVNHEMGHWFYRQGYKIKEVDSDMWRKAVREGAAQGTEEKFRYNISAYAYNNLMNRSGETFAESFALYIRKEYGDIPPLLLKLFKENF